MSFHGGKTQKILFSFLISEYACCGTVVCNGTTYRKPALFIFQELYQISVHIHLKPGFCSMEWFGVFSPSLFHFAFSQHRMNMIKGNSHQGQRMEGLVTRHLKIAR